jgi:hypothetical protein
MSNPASKITYTVYENNKIVLTGTIHYALLHLVEQSLKSDGDRYIEFSIGDAVCKRVYNNIDFPVESSDNRHIDLLIYNKLVEFKKLQFQYDELKKDHDLKLIQQHELAEQHRLANIQIEQEKEIYELQKQKELAEKIRNAEENLKLIIERDRLLFESIVTAQKELLKNYAITQEKETTRLANLEHAVINKLTEDPLSVVDALKSEVAKSYQVQHYIANAITANTDAALLILNSDTALWNKSFSIMESLALKARTETIIANLIGEVLPEDSTVVYMLKKLGYIKTLTP